jgi:hypothetical protein
LKKKKSVVRVLRFLKTQKKTGNKQKEIKTEKKNKKRASSRTLADAVRSHLC